MTPTPCAGDPSRDRARPGRRESSSRCRVEEAGARTRGAGFRTASRFAPRPGRALGGDLPEVRGSEAPLPPRCVTSCGVCARVFDPERILWWARDGEPVEPGGPYARELRRGCVMLCPRSALGVETSRMREDTRSKGPSQASLPPSRRRVTSATPSPRGDGAAPVPLEEAAGRAETMPFDRPEPPRTAHEHRSRG